VLLAVVVAVVPLILHPLVKVMHVLETLVFVAVVVELKMVMVVLVHLALLVVIYKEQVILVEKGDREEMVVVEVEVQINQDMVAIMNRTLLVKVVMDFVEKHGEQMVYIAAVVGVVLRMVIGHHVEALKVEAITLV
jgi:hypothetical protein